MPPLCGTEAACVAAGDCVHARRLCRSRRAGVRAVGNPRSSRYLRDASDKSLVQREGVYRLRTTGSRPWCYVRDSVCINDECRVGGRANNAWSQLRFGLPVRRTSEKICTALAIRSSRADHMRPGRSPTWDTGCDVCPSGRVSPLGSHATATRTGQARSAPCPLPKLRPLRRNVCQQWHNAISAPTAHSQTPTGRHASLAQLMGRSRGQLCDIRCCRRTE